MARKSEKPIKRVSFFLYEDDIERMKIFYPKLPWSVLVREIVHSHVNEIEERAAQSATPIPKVNVRVT